MAPVDNRTLPADLPETAFDAGDLSKAGGMRSSFSTRRVAIEPTGTMGTRFTKGIWYWVASPCAKAGSQTP